MMPHVFDQPMLLPEALIRVANIYRNYAGSANQTLRRDRASVHLVLHLVTWKSIEDAPRDELIEVFAPGGPCDLPDLVSLCQWHPDAGFCVCELREPTHWRPFVRPE